MPEEIISEIRERADIVEVISSYFPLKKAGRNFRALCPFHQEKTPSFFVSPERGIFHCFGCGVGGNSINFVMLYEKLTFPEAVRVLAERTGVKFPRGEKRNEKYEEEKNNLLKVYQQAGEFYRKCLFSRLGQPAQQYLKKRGLSLNLIRKFQLGYAPTAGKSLAHHLFSLGWGRDFLEKAGLVVVKEREHYYDRFRNRIIFPLRNLKGEIIAFGGRSLDENLPKYLNSPENLCYHKSSHLYGLFLHKEEIYRKGAIIVVEGYLDLLKLEMVGISNVVATLGTALTEGHLRLLRRFTSEVYLVYDGDESGQTAALRGLELLENSELKIKIVPLPPDFDPDSFIDQQGKNSFLSLLERAYSIFDYRLERAMSGVEITQTEGKLKVVNEILPFLLRVENEIERSEYIKKVSHLLQIREADLIREVNKRKEKGEKTFQITPPSSLEYKIGTGLIKFALLNSEKIERLKEIDLEEFRDEKIKKIIQILIELFQQKVPLSPAKIMDYLPEEELRDFLSEVIIKGEEEKEEVFGDYLKKMKQIQLRRKIEKLKEEIARAENEKKAQQLIELLQKYRRWRLELNSLS